MAKASTPKGTIAFRRRLLAWFRRAGRDLPWRRTRDPWAVVVSEFMLQQTQVSRVLDYYQPFLRSYPDPASLARATWRDVREEWEGLGYYRRAANLQRLARMVVREYECGPGAEQILQKRKAGGSGDRGIEKALRGQ